MAEETTPRIRSVGKERFSQGPYLGLASQISTPKETLEDIERRFQRRPPRLQSQLQRPTCTNSERQNCQERSRVLHQSPPSECGKRKELQLRPRTVSKKLFGDHDLKTWPEVPSRPQIIRLPPTFEDYMDVNLIKEESRKLSLQKKGQVQLAKAGANAHTILQSPDTDRSFNSPAVDLLVVHEPSTSKDSNRSQDQVVTASGVNFDYSLADSQES